MSAEIIRFPRNRIQRRAAQIRQWIAEAEIYHASGDFQNAARRIIRAAQARGRQDLHDEIYDTMGRINRAAERADTRRRSIRRGTPRRR
jgi:hypothetical protein